MFPYRGTDRQRRVDAYLLLAQSLGTAGHLQDCLGGPWRTRQQWRVYSIPYRTPPVFTVSRFPLYPISSSSVSLCSTRRVLRGSSLAVLSLSATASRPARFSSVPHPLWLYLPSPSLPHALPLFTPHLVLPAVPPASQPVLPEV